MKLLDLQKSKSEIYIISICSSTEIMAKIWNLKIAADKTAQKNKLLHHC